MIITINIQSLTSWKVTLRSVTNKNITYSEADTAFNTKTFNSSPFNRIVIKSDAYNIIDGVPRQFIIFSLDHSFLSKAEPVSSSSRMPKIIQIDS